MNKPSHKKIEWKNLFIIFIILIPSIITYLSYQHLFELVFKTLSNEQLLLLIPSDGGLALFMIGVFLFFGCLVTLIFHKKSKAKKVSAVLLLVSIFTILIGSQNYTAFTTANIIESRGYKLSKTYHAYDNLDKIEIKVDMSGLSGARNYALNCGPYFQIIGLLNPYKKVFTARIAPVDKELAYKLIDILHTKNIPLQSMVLNNCMQHPDQFKNFENEFNQKMVN